MSNWLTSTFQTVREKSLDAIEFVRKDLVEFTSTVKNDTENYLHKIQSQPVGEFRIQKIVSRLSSQKGTPENVTPFDRLQNDESTYLLDPSPIEAYEKWRETSQFNIDESKAEITQLLIDAPHVRSIYARCVPACTTHSDFWSRYYFRLHQLNEEETRRINLLKRAEEICNETHGNDWEEDPDDEWSKDVSQPMSTRKESETSDSWEREFDEPDLPTSKINPISSNNSTTVSNNPDDEWESWS